MIALPPLLAEGVKLTVACPLPAVAVPIVGAPGTTAPEPTATVTMYVFVELYADVTVYITELVKFCAPVGLMLAPLWVIVGIRLVTFVPKGTVTAIVPALSLMVPATPARVKDVILTG